MARKKEKNAPNASCGFYFLISFLSAFQLEVYYIMWAEHAISGMIVL